MMKSDLFWGGAFVVLLMLGYGVIPTPGKRTLDDSFSEAAAGKKAFYLVAEELLSEVSRSTESLIPPDDDADTLVLLGPARYPDRAQWQTLYDWVADGRALVFAARWSDPAVDLEPFGIEVVPLDNLDRLDRAEPEALDEPNASPGPANDARPLQTDLVEGALEWQSQGEVRTSASDATVELSQNGTAQVVWRPIGDGAIVVVASDYVFTNRSLAADAQGLLAFRILETAAPSGPAYFDESMNAAGAPRVVGILFEEPFRLITLQVLIVVVLFGWMVSRRFGPLQAAEGTARRSLVEHAEALGNLHFKAGSGVRLVSSYLEFFRRDLGLRHSVTGVGFERDTAIPRGDADELDAVLVEARSSGVSRGSVAEVVRSLARLRSRAD